MSTEDSKKRVRNESPPLANADKKPARRSRFEPVNPPSLPSTAAGGGGEQSVLSAAAIAAAKAMEITRALQEQGQGQTQGYQVPASVASVQSREKALQEARARELQAQVAAQMASVTSLLASAREASVTKEKKPAFRPLLLDSLGREVDEKGQVVIKNQVAKTLAANAAVIKAKKENPYLAHRAKPEAPSSVLAVAPGVALGAEEVAVGTVTTAPSMDPRLKGTSSRDQKAKKSFHFVEEGTYVKEADQLRAKEERKVIAGYSSGRKRPDQEGDERKGGSESSDEGGEEDGGGDDVLAIYGRGDVTEGGGGESDELSVTVPPPADGGVVPVMEWWDEAFLPKPTRDQRRRSKASQQEDHSAFLAPQNCRTLSYVQHPVPIRSLGGEHVTEPLKMYLTKKERKRIRRTARHEREMEKRDKIMMGLIPAPEPKFKLSNFMKILGDQAVADPSKVERRVVQQMKQRLLSHEMRNEAARLTPAEKREKKKKKLQEDTSRQVEVAIFRIVDFSDAKHRFKVDVNMQQLNLTGTVVLCPAAKTNLVVAEGGPKGIRKLVHLMTNRVEWTKGSEGIVKRGGVSGAGSSRPSAPLGLEQYGRAESYSGEEKGEEDGEDGEEELKEEDENDEDEDLQELDLNSDKSGNRCDLLWQGSLPKKTFHALRFQECRSSAAARKVLEAKGVAHYWDMAARADEIIASGGISY